MAWSPRRHQNRAPGAGKGRGRTPGLPAPPSEPLSEENRGNPRGPAASPHTTRGTGLAEPPLRAGPARSAPPPCRTALPVAAAGEAERPRGPEEAATPGPHGRSGAGGPRRRRAGLGRAGRGAARAGLWRYPRPLSRFPLSRFPQPGSLSPGPPALPRRPHSQLLDQHHLPAAPRTRRSPARPRPRPRAQSRSAPRAEGRTRRPPPIRGRAAPASAHLTRRWPIRTRRAGSGAHPPSLPVVPAG